MTQFGKTSSLCFLLLMIPVFSSAQPQAFEFQGVYKIGEKWMFSILDKATDRSEWVSLNEDTSPGYKVTRYDPETNAVSIQIDNRNQRLTLRDRSDTPIPVILAQKTAPPVAPVKQKVHPVLPKRPPTTVPAYLPPTPPPNFTPPPLPKSIAGRRALLSRSYASAAARGLSDSISADQPPSGQPTQTSDQSAPSSDNPTDTAATDTSSGTAAETGSDSGSGTGQTLQGLGGGLFLPPPGLPPPGPPPGRRPPRKSG